jgi:hypothetical protein
MNYLSFCFAIFAVYALYYAGNIGFDYFLAGRLGTDKEVEDVIDISSAMSKYTPKDAGSIIERENKKNPLQDILDKRKDVQPIAVNQTGGVTLDELKNLFELNAKEDFFRGMV